MLEVVTFEADGGGRGDVDESWVDMVVSWSEARRESDSSGELLPAICSSSSSSASEHGALGSEERVDLVTRALRDLARNKRVVPSDLRLIFRGDGVMERVSIETSPSAGVTGSDMFFFGAARGL